MFAVFKTGGKQYRVQAGDVIEVERLAAGAGSEVAFTEVLAVGDAAGLTVGRPHLAGAKVTGQVVAETRGPKLIVFKKRRRKNSRRKTGHRQTHTAVKITAIAPAQT